MQTIDLDDLALVHGGRGHGQQAQPQQQAADPSQQQAQPATQMDQQPQLQVGNGNFLQGLDQFLSFFQSDSFQQLMSGIRGLIGQFSAGSGAPQAGQQ
ncbi:MAG: hypothetical protein QM831_36935 [Kofleriaceae bacterium]